MTMNVVPGHGGRTQVRFSRSLPLHGSPPYSGGGLLQVRERCFVPTPHVPLHGVKSPHAPQLPSTENKIS